MRILYVFLKYGSESTWTEDEGCFCTFVKVAADGCYEFLSSNHAFICHEDRIHNFLFVEVVEA